MNWQDEPKMKAWKENIAASGCIMNNLTPLHLIHKSNGELLFALCKADVATPKGNKLPPIVLIRGNVVVIVPLAKNRDTGEQRFITVVQHRIGSGGMEGIEFPAGMMDRKVSDPIGVALDELGEETGIHIAASDLFPLHDTILYSSPGLQDEGVFYYGCVLEMADAEYRSLEGRKTGEVSEGESIRVSLKTGEEIKQLTNAAQVLLGLFLFQFKQEAGAGRS
jgi:8-oxo-dGTP pyrophosphatase MutT (NUDIX family)